MHQRVSTDRGMTWGPVRGEGSRYECDWTVEGGVFMVAIAARGSRMVATEMGCGFYDCNTFMEKSKDRFAHTEFQSLGEDQAHVVGFVVVNGAPVLADAFSTATRIRFRRETAP
jgi:hypothetical protein